MSMKRPRELDTGRRTPPLSHTPRPAKRQRMSAEDACAPAGHRAKCTSPIIISHSPRAGTTNDKTSKTSKLFYVRCLLNSDIFSNPKLATPTTHTSQHRWHVFRLHAKNKQDAVRLAIKALRSRADPNHFDNPTPRIPRRTVPTTAWLRGLEHGSMSNHVDAALWHAVQSLEAQTEDVFSVWVAREQRERDEAEKRWSQHLQLGMMTTMDVVDEMIGAGSSTVVDVNTKGVVGAALARTASGGRKSPRPNSPRPGSPRVGFVTGSESGAGFYRGSGAASPRVDVVQTVIDVAQSAGWLRVDDV